MREIKFRAWDKNRKRMWYSFEDDVRAISTNNGTKIIAGMEHPDDGYVSEYILMQFTCLLDKNGKEIWEGDIVKTDKPQTCGGVSFDTFKIIIRDGDVWIDTLKKGFWSRLHELEDDIELIGNIWENNEMI